MNSFLENSYFFFQTISINFILLYFCRKKKEISYPSHKLSSKETYSRTFLFSTRLFCCIFLAFYTEIYKTKSLDIPSGLFSTYTIDTYFGPEWDFSSNVVIYTQDLCAHVNTIPKPLFLLSLLLPILFKSDIHMSWVYLRFHISIALFFLIQK